MKNLYFKFKDRKIGLLLCTTMMLLVNALGFAQINTVLNTQISGEITAVAGGSTGTNYNITLPKPAGATTVNKVFIYYTHALLSGGELGANAVQVNGVTMNLNTYTQSGTTLVGYCRYAEVSTTATAFVNTLNTMAAGATTTVNVNEGGNSQKIDGVGILILWNVPTKPLGRFVIQMGSLITGPVAASQSFTVNSIDKTLLGFSATMGVGISFSTGDFTSNYQRSQLKIGAATPTAVVTSNAGGYDDGRKSNGALITLGGYGDSPSTNDDDELYDVASFLINGQTQISYSLKDLDNVYDDYINVVYFTSSGISSPCLAGTVAPALSATTVSNICPAVTADLTALAATNQPTGTSLTFHTAATATAGNQISGTSLTAGTYYVAFYDSVSNCYSPATQVTVIINLCVCYNAPNISAAGANTQHGITLLQRAGGTNSDWPMVRKSAQTVLESNTKGFVITRMTTAQILAIVSPQEGMMVYDTVAKCLKINSTGTATGWSCFSTPACP